MLREQAEKEVDEARRLGHMNLTKELDGLQKYHDSEDGGPFDACFWHKMEIWREMARRIEALEEAMGEHRTAIHELLNPREGL